MQNENLIESTISANRLDWKALSSKAVWVAALGYMVDLYDLVLFGIVRVPSLKGIGVPESDLLEVGSLLLNLQMGGMLIGGFAWGMLGDRFGRMKAMYGSILLYSTANILNGFVESVPAYGALRFIAGIGLAGELGAAITLVSEILPKHIRGLGSMFIGLAGFIGAICAAILGNFVSWRWSYFIGGGLGILLLLARVGVSESLMFTQSKRSSIWKDTITLFTTPSLAWRYFRCLMIGMQIWFVAGILVYFSPEIARELSIEGTVLAGQAILWNYVGGIGGDILGGLLSQRLKSRKKAIRTYSIVLASMIPAYLWLLKGTTPASLYFFCFLLGIGCGYWVVFIAMTAEQFGTNIRATVTTSIPNLARASVIPMTLALGALKPELGLVNSALLIGIVCSLLGIFSLNSLPETFHKDLNYQER